MAFLTERTFREGLFVENTTCTWIELVGVIPTVLMLSVLPTRPSLFGWRITSITLRVETNTSAPLVK